MKKIINGKKYDTDTAEFIASFSPSGYACNDLYWYEEDLYRKQTGEFFLVGTGSAGSKYNKSAGQNSWTGSRRIVPLLDCDAREWAEEHLSGDQYENLFGEVKE